ncbi:hypothetical protein O0I10_001426 [Lichtheimia ornata]|uniref:DUF4396 domain-containing protein n=1 Tax=Lichtheimia ornata TaxID=688661 RepID=A0AAD7Y2U6_9FUNG|nr:uncharacterized protein O0I10_001426 [Lichtheimia ornata]KAJ8662467.1 hypothetical protein O0I10_001426 [Lichtheimia ornata]
MSLTTLQSLRTPLARSSTLPLKVTTTTLAQARRTSSSCCSHQKKQQEQEPIPPITSLAFWKDSVSWQRTRVNTFRCLIGCTTGDFSTMWYLQANHPTMSPVWMTAAAMAAGITSSLALETVLLRRTLGLSYSDSFKTAMGMSFASMLAMELAENAVDWHLMGGRVAFDDPQFWLAAAASAGAGYLVPLPFNYWRLRALGKSCH